MTKSSIRPARAADIPRLQEIERAAAELFRPLGLLTLDEAAGGVVSEAEHDAAIAAGLAVCAESGGELAGFAMGEPHGKSAYLHEIDVAPAFQRKGLGRALVDAFCVAANAQGAREVFLSTFRDVPWNAPFYATCGFLAVPRGAYADWMRAIAAAEAEKLDIAKRVFMRRAL